MTVIRSSHIAMYVQIAEEMASAIHSGQYPPLSRLPSESELMERFQVSRVTIRLALQVLLERNLIVRRQGKGTFVTGPTVRQDSRQLQGFFDGLIAQGLTPQTRLLGYRLQVPSAPMRKLLQLGEKERCIQIKRLHLVEKVPLALVCVSLPEALTTQVTRERMESTPIYTLVTRVMGCSVGQAALSIRVQRLDARRAGLLGLAAGDPALVLERLSYDQEARPLEHTLLYLRPDGYEVRFMVRDGLAIGSTIRPAAAGHAPSR
ncbi:MAG: GntR family transcriptional regulator [Bacillota bacterium]